jgi:hypothetical protein
MKVTRKFTKKVSYGLGALILTLCTLAGIRRPAWAEQTQELTARDAIIALKSKLEILEHKENLTSDEVNKINELDDTIDTYLIQEEARENAANLLSTEKRTTQQQLRSGSYKQLQQARGF